MTKMDHTSLDWYHLIERGKNFYWDFESFETSAIERKAFYIELCQFKNSVTPNLWRLRNSRSQMLTSLFSEIYGFVSRYYEQFTYFLMGSPLSGNMSEACLFTTLCWFLNKTKRLKGKSLNKFIYDNSLYSFNDKNSIEYCFPDQYSDFLNSKASTLRKRRHRHLSSRPVYDERSQWSAMPKDSEYEWNLYHILVDDAPPDIKYKWISEHNLSPEEFDIIQDTFKRIGNLYKDIEKALETEKGDDYKDKLLNAYKKFTSKLKKLKYENYLELQKMILSYISEEPKYLGINTYRFEKEFKLCIITNEINSLLYCETDGEKDKILTRSVILKDICFPKLYKDLFDISFDDELVFCVEHFPDFMNITVSSCCLVIDELIEHGFMGDDWEIVFLNLLNEMTEHVFYNPKEIDFSITPKSQEKFMELLSAPVRDILDSENVITFP